MRELRRDPLTGAWVALCTDHVVTGGHAVPPAAPPEADPFVAGDVPVIASAHGCWATPHREPVVRVEAGEHERRDGPGRIRPGLGAHEVVVEGASPRPLHDQPVERSVAALTFARSRHVDLRRDGRLQWAGWRRVTGGSLAHPHSEVVALPLVPPRVQHVRAHLAAHPGRVAEVVAHERATRQRVVWEDGPVVAWAPLAPAVPFALRVLGDAEAPHWHDASDERMERVAHVLWRLSRALQTALGPHRCEWVLMQGAVHQPVARGWWVDVLPATRVGGRSLGGMMPAHPCPPEEVAGQLGPLCHDAAEEDPDPP